MKNYIDILNEKDLSEFMRQEVKEYSIKDGAGLLKVCPLTKGCDIKFHFDNYSFRMVNYMKLDYSHNWRRFVMSKLNPEDKKSYVEEFNRKLEAQKLSINDTYSV